MNLSSVKKLLILCCLLGTTVRTNATSMSIPAHFIWTVAGMAYGKGIIKLNADNEKLATDTTLSKDTQSKEFLKNLGLYALQVAPTLILFACSKAHLGSYLHELGTCPHHLAIWVGGVFAGVYYEVKNNPNLPKNTNSSTVATY